MSPPIEPKKLTPPQLARRLGVGTDKVLNWIRTGELRAINGATKPNGRPRYLVDIEDLEAFENRRAVTPRRVAATRTETSSSDVTKYF
jgi:excisionase family DNA binding protein